MRIIVHDTIKDLNKIRAQVRIARQHMASDTGQDSLTEIDLIAERRGEKLGSLKEEELCKSF